MLVAGEIRITSSNFLFVHIWYFKVDYIFRGLILASQEDSNESLKVENANLGWRLRLVGSFSCYADLRENLPTTTLYPTKDSDGNPLETEYGLCRFKDHQTVTIQVYYLHNSGIRLVV